MDALQQAIQKLYFWQYSNSGSFHDCLYDLFQKADNFNKVKLAEAFPEEFVAITLWNKAGDYGNDLFRERGLMK